MQRIQQDTREDSRTQRARRWGQLRLRRHVPARVERREQGRIVRCAQVREGARWSARGRDGPREAMTCNGRSGRYWASRRAAPGSTRQPTLIHVLGKMRSTAAIRGESYQRLVPSAQYPVPDNRLLCLTRNAYQSLRRNPALSALACTACYLCTSKTLIGGRLLWDTC